MTVVALRQASLRQPYRTALVPALRRVDGVRFVVGDGTMRAEVYGIGHKFPVTVPVSVKLAAWLLAAGAPLSVVRDRTAGYAETA